MNIIKLPFSFLYRYYTFLYLVLKKSFQKSDILSEGNWNSLIQKVVTFVEGLRIDRQDLFLYKYSNSTTSPNLYSSVYACLIFGLFDKIKLLSEDDKNRWIKYFDSFQNNGDGLFYDSSLYNENYETCNWWGSQHLAVHIISAYKELNSRPKYQFKFLEKYYDFRFLETWLNSYDWNSPNVGEDIDNHIMNITSLLQYQRDYFSDKKAEQSLDWIKAFLLSKRNNRTGMWGGYNIDNPKELSRMVQFAYHLYPVFFYDNYFEFDCDVIAETILKTQNSLGGYGYKYNSSACEDIDSIDLMIAIYPYLSPELSKKCDKSLKKTLKWVLLNQCKDGGFVFRLNEPFEYGHANMRSKINEGAIFPTWFRVLSVIHLIRHFEPYSNYFKVKKSPGLEFC